MQGMGKESTQPPPSPPCAALGPCLARPISRGKPSPTVSRPWQSLAITPGINRRPGAGGGISCAEGDSGPPGNGCEPRWARPCEASGALLLSNGGSGGGHVPCTLWPPPAPFGYFPVMESTSSARRRTKPPTRNRFLMEDKGRAFLAFPISQRVSPLRRRPKGFPVALWKPSALCCAWGIPQETDSLWQAGKEPSLLFPVSRKVSPLRRRPGGFPLAPWTPSGKRALRIALFSNKTIRPAGTRRGAVPYAFSGGSPQTLSLPLPMLLA